MKFLFMTRAGQKDPGARIRCFGLAEKLKEKGLNARVFSFVDNLRAKSGKEDAKFVFRRKLKYSYKGFSLLLKETKPLILIINRFNYHTIPAWLVSMVKKIPFIFDMDDWEAREGSGSKAEYFTRFFARRSIFCIAASRYLQDYLLQFNKKVYYIPTAVDTDKFKPSPHIEKKDFVFSWHGSVNRIEIIEYLKFIIECFLSLYKKCPAITFYIAGDGIFKKELIRLIEHYKCAKIIYKGWLNYDSISSYLDGIDCGLIPLLDKTKFNLSKSPVKLFEYMAKAKSVVASNTGEANHIIQNGCNGFLASTKDEFVFNMERLINNPQLVENIGMAARKTTQEYYSLDIMGERLVRILKDDFNNNSNL